MVNYVQKAVDSLEESRQAVLHELSRIDAALAALGETSSLPDKRSQASKPSCTKKEVIEILAGLLRDNGSLTATELGDLAKDKLVNERNKDLKGFAMRLREALADPLFKEVTPGTYRLAPVVAR